MFHSLTLCTSIAANRAISPEHRIHPVMSDLEDDELLLQVAGRSKPSARPSGKKRKRGSISISEDDDDDDDDDYSAEQEDGEMEDEPQIEAASRGKSSAEKSRKMQTSEKDPGGKSDDDFEDGYDSDLMGDDEDRARLNAMDELDREMILADRAEARDAAMERKRAEQALRQQQEQQQRAAEKAAPTRASTRAKLASKATEKFTQQGAAQIAAAKADKEEKMMRRRQRAHAESDDDSQSERSRSARSSPDRSSYEERGGRSDSDDDSDRRRYGRDSDSDDALHFQELDEAEAISLDDALKMQVKRYMLERWVSEPFFEATLTGCLVRLSFRKGYLACEITGIEERPPGKYRDPGYSFDTPYKLEDGRETHKWLQLQVGTNPRTMPISLISNAPISEKEWQHWKDTCDADNKPQLNTHDCESAQKRIKKASSYTYTAEDVQRMIEEKRTMGVSKRNVAAERARLTTLMDQAEENQDIDAVEQLELQLHALEDREQARQREEKNNMAAVNKKNAARNFQNAFKNVGARPEGARTADDGVDPFSRRKTRPMNYWNTNKQRGAAAGAGGPGGLSVSAARVADGEDGAPETPAVAASTTENEEGGLDLNIDMSALDIVAKRHPLLQQVFGQHWMAQSVPKPPADMKPDRVLSLAEYRRRLENIVG